MYGVEVPYWQSNKPARVVAVAVASTNYTCGTLLSSSESGRRSDCCCYSMPSTSIPHVVFGHLDLYSLVRGGVSVSLTTSLRIQLASDCTQEGLLAGNIHEAEKYAQGDRASGGRWAVVCASNISRIGEAVVQSLALVDFLEARGMVWDQSQVTMLCFISTDLVGGGVGRGTDSGGDRLPSVA